MWRAEQSADVIVVGARGNTGLRRFMLGSVAIKLAHDATTSLLIVEQP
jgi:nucleotide-binding universal stress UspA family protein